jgi:hypothetical protein
MYVGKFAAEIVDCRSPFIVAAIPQNRFSDVEIGGMAHFRLSGDNVNHEGRVLAVTGDASVANDRNLAAAPSAQRTATAMVRIEAPASRNTADGCFVGRTTRVLLPTTPGSGLLARLARTFF